MSNIEISVVCPVGRFMGDLLAVHREFRDVLAQTGRVAEFIYVLDGPLPEAEERLEQLREERFPVFVLRMARGFGEATALQVGFRQARGRYVLTIPDCLQIEAAVVKEVLSSLDRGEQVVITRRYPRNDAFFNRLQSNVFHALVRRLVRQDFKDLTCGVRGFPRDVALHLDLYGDQHRFIPVIAVRSGLRVTEIPGRQHPGNKGLRVFRPSIYFHRLLDLLNIYFLTRFTRRPLRFFGLIGAVVSAIGLLLDTWLAGEKLIHGSPIADRPLLLLGTLLIVLGVQITSIGLIGEIIIFLSNRREIPEVNELSDGGEPQPLLRSAEPASAPA